MVSTQMTLIVGCTTDLTITQNPGFITDVHTFVGDSALNIYTVLPPTIFPTYCLVSSYDIVNLQLNGTTSTGDIFPSASCSGVQPCSTLDLLTSQAA